MAQCSGPLDFGVAGHSAAGSRTGAPAGGKVCVIGLDGATFKVLDKWLASGDMPSLGKLLERGARSELTSTIPPVTGPAWTSMTTGVNPAQHGIYDFLKWSESGGSPSLVQSSDCSVPRLWDTAGDAGMQVGVFRVPITYPAWAVNGFMVTGLLSRANDHTTTHPPELHSELTQRGLGWFLVDEKDRSPLQRVEEQIEIHDRSHQAMEFLLQKHNPDFFFCVLGELDNVQHFLWPYCNKDSDATDRRVKAAVRHFFRQLDTTLGFLVDRIGHDATFYLVSDHGFGPVTKAFRINNFLARRGFLAVRSGRVLRINLTLRTARFLKRVMKKTGTIGIARALLHSILPGGLLTMNRPGRTSAVLDAAVDWTRSRAYAKLEASCGIYVNVKGRTPSGIVEPGAQYERTIKDLTAALDSARDPKTGQKLVTLIVRPNQVHSGPWLGEAPDLFVGLQGGSVQMEPMLGGPLITGPARPGGHRMEGILVAAGPPIAKGAAVAANILDVAPTVLYTMGLPVPAYMEGSVLNGLFREEVLRKRPVEYAEMELDACRGSRAPASTTQEEEKAVEGRLRDLGYL